MAKFLKPLNVIKFPEWKSIQYIPLTFKQEVENEKEL